MKRINVLAITALTLSCRNPSQATVGHVSMTAANASYTPVAESKIGVLAFDLIIRNDENVPARLGCGMSIDRKDKTGIKTIVLGACLATESPSKAAERDGDIPPRSSDTLQIRRDISSQDFEKDATFRAALAIAFGPSFRRGLPFKSEWFKPVEKPAKDIREIRRLLSNTR